MNKQVKSLGPGPNPIKVFHHRITLNFPTPKCFKRKFHVKNFGVAKSSEILGQFFVGSVPGRAQCQLFLTWWWWWWARWGWGWRGGSPTRAPRLAASTRPRSRWCWSSTRLEDKKSRCESGKTDCCISSFFLHPCSSESLDLRLKF